MELFLTVLSGAPIIRSPWHAFLNRPGRSTVVECHPRPHTGATRTYAHRAPASPRLLPIDPAG
jgi:hypothetical protein